MDSDSDKKSSGAAVIATVDVKEARNLINQGHRCLDVRTEEEFENGHFESAINIPYMFKTPQGRVKNPKFMDQVLAVCGREDKLVVGCQSGVRSVYATTDLLQAEFKHVCNMGGGYIEWVANGLPIKIIDKPPPNSHHPNPMGSL
ncbi:thiosulfate sulfurtransferase 18 isoform X2 [Andrographis paniculata]|uniref:thiosulfate sulfurtransferase 18 isoform X2 n=1 Tax=Andrographis paniculata TaxID=175694 RepID=UPI0021E7A683|nr:thiosulfate sulfurtransferase 18 isoform X2 [Andrographis paniculata]